MGDPFERSKLSRTSWISLVILLGANLALFGFYSRAEISTVGPITQVVSAQESLQLVVELDEVTRARMASPGDSAVERQLPQMQIEQPPVVRVCRSWGPFTSEESLAQIRAKVALAADSVQVRQDEMTSAPDYLVYLDSDNNLDNARRLLKEMESQELDAYVIAGGEYVNSVSAGVFSNRSRADQQMRKLRDLGYEPRLESLERIQTVHYLTARVPEGFNVEGAEASPCEEIASAG